MSEKIGARLQRKYVRVEISPVPKNPIPIQLYQDSR